MCAWVWVWDCRLRLLCARERKHPSVAPQLSRDASLSRLQPALPAARATAASSPRRSRSRHRRGSLQSRQQSNEGRAPTAERRALTHHRPATQKRWTLPAVARHPSAPKVIPRAQPAPAGLQPPLQHPRSIAEVAGAVAVEVAGVEEPARHLHLSQVLTPVLREHGLVAFCTPPNGTLLWLEFWLSAGARRLPQQDSTPSMHFRARVLPLPLLTPFLLSSTPLNRYWPGTAVLEALQRPHLSGKTEGQPYRLYIPELRRSTLACLALLLTWHAIT